MFVGKEGRAAQKRARKNETFFKLFINMILEWPARCQNSSFTARIRRMREGNVFTGVCPFTGGGGGTPISGSFPGHWPQVLSRGRCPSPGWGYLGPGLGVPLLRYRRRTFLMCKNSTIHPKHLILIALNKVTNINYYYETLLQLPLKVMHYRFMNIIWWTYEPTYGK